jgi:heme exporter protein C
MSASRLASRAYGLRWRVLPPIVGIGMMAMIIGAVVAAPREIIQGEVQRLLYIHLGSIAAAYFSFAIVFVASIMVLWKRDMRWDAVARAAVTVGVLFTGLVLLTGAIWGRPIWGVYWSWDARLTSTLILFLIFVAYLLVRAVADNEDERTARYAAVFAIIGCLDIPIIHLSVRWWRTLHPGPTVIRTDPQLPGEMQIVLLISVLAILALATWFIVMRTATERTAQRLHTLRATLDQREGA